MVAHTCNPITGEVEARKSGVQGHPEILNKFKASLGYLRLCLKIFIKAKNTPNQTKTTKPHLKQNLGHFETLKLNIYISVERINLDSLHIC